MLYFCLIKGSKSHEYLRRPPDKLLSAFLAAAGGRLFFAPAYKCHSREFSPSREDGKHTQTQGFSALPDAPHGDLNEMVHITHDGQREWRMDGFVC